MSLIKGMAVGALLAVLFAGGASAACGPMVLLNVPSTIQLSFADLDESGKPSHGDKRVGEVHLTDGDGNHVGNYYWVATVHAVDSAGETTHMRADTFFVLDDGTIFNSVIHEPAVSLDNLDTTVVPEVTERVITGGTGAYAGAKGTIDVTRDGMQFVFQLNMTCDQ